MAGVGEQRYVHLGGLRFHYLHWANPDALAIICLHGTGDTCHTWDAFSKKASETYSVIALDQRGHGDSDWAVPPAYRCEDYVGDLSAFIDALDLKKFILVGHSMGALHCTWYASERPERVAALVHVDIAPQPPPWNKRYLMGLYETLPEWYDSPKDLVKEIREASAFAPDGLLLHLASSNLEQRADGRFYRKCDRNVFRSFDNYDLTRRLTRVECPTLVVRGAESRVFIAQTAQEMRRSLSQGRLAEIPAAGHPVQSDNSEIFNEVVMRFLHEVGLKHPGLPGRTSRTG